MQLLLGCGSSREKKFWLPDHQEWEGLVTLDFDADHKPDVVADIDSPLPFADDTFDEIHAYEVLEHLGTQGDWKHWFAEWTEYHRIIKPGGVFLGTVPWYKSVWAWGDPGHTRAIPPTMFSFLEQSHYGQVGEDGSPSTDYRFIYKVDWEVVNMQFIPFKGGGGDKDEGALVFALRARSNDE